MFSERSPVTIHYCHQSESYHSCLFPPQHSPHIDKVGTSSISMELLYVAMEGRWILDRRLLVILNERLARVEKGR